MTIAGAILGLGCGPEGSDAGGTTGGGESSTAAVPEGGGMLSAADASGTTTVDASTSTSAVDPGSSSSSTTDEPKFDLPAPTVETCDADPMPLVDLEVVTPEGSLAVMHGWWGFQSCCSDAPRLVLAQADTLEVINDTVQTDHASVRVIGYGTGPYTGPVSVGLEYGAATSTEITAGFALLTSHDPELPVSGTTPRLSASSDLEQDGWTLRGDIDVPHCDALDELPCPCE